MYTVELDCPPGTLRPGDLFSELLKTTQLKEENFKLCSRFFGNWTWEFIEENSIYEEKRETIKEIITEWYSQGVIR